MRKKHGLPLEKKNQSISALLAGRPSSPSADIMSFFFKLDKQKLVIMWERRRLLAPPCWQVHRVCQKRAASPPCQNRPRTDALERPASGPGFRFRVCALGFRV